MTLKREEALERANELKIKPGETVYCVLRHVASTGMSRRISFFVMRENEPRGIDHIIAGLGCAGARWARKNGMIQDGVYVGGCGMDMGFAVVYDFGRDLFPDGFKVKGVGRNGDTSGHDNDGGYALQHRWL